MSYKKVWFHTHDFTYTANDATITATCSNTKCYLPEGVGKHTATLTIAAKGGTYDGTTKYPATIKDLYVIQGEAKIQYQKKTSESTYDTATETAPTEAGDYKASITLGEGNNVATASVEYKIDPATLTQVSVTQSGTLTYTGSEQTPQVTTAATAKGGQTVTFTYSKTQDGTYGDMPTVTNVDDGGTFYYKASAPNHADLTGSFTVTVKPASLTNVSVAQKGTLTYTGDAQTPQVTTAATAVNAQAVNFTYSKTRDGEYNTDVPTVTDVVDGGTFYYKASAPNHADTTGSFTVTVTPATLADVSVAQNGTLTYTGSAQTPQVTTAATAVNAQAVNFTYSKTRDGEYNTAVPTVTDVVDGGTFYYKASAPNHADTTGSFTVTVNKGTPPTVNEPTLEAVTYDPAKKLSDITLTGGWAWVDGTTVPTVSNSGYSATLTVDDANYDYTGVEGYNSETHKVTRTISLTVNKAYAAPSTITPNNRIYDKTEKPLLNVSGDPVGGVMKYALGTDDRTEPDEWGDTIPNGTEIGTYYVWYKVVATNENYKDTDPVCIPVTIKKKPAPVTPSKFTVTFIVVNGAWDDESSTTKTVTTDKLTASQIPGVGNNPDEGYMAGSWNKTPSTSITGSTTYIYTYAEKPLPEIITEPTGKDLTETGDEQELITAGTATGGTLQYTLGASDGTYASSIPKATEAGTYYVWYKVKGDADHRDTDPTNIEVTIKENTKSAASITKAPEGKDLTANGEAQELITAGEVSGGTMEYGVGIITPTTWSSSIPTATAAGTYTVWYRAKGDEEHSNSKPQSIVVTIKYGSDTMVYNGEEQDLVIAGSAEGGTMLYALGTDDVTPPEGNWSETVPTGKDPGTYYVWYKVEGDENHNDVAPVCIKVTIVPDSQVSQFEEGLKTLPEDVTRDDEELVDALRQMYDGLRTDQKSQIPEEDLKKLETAEDTLEELKAEDQGKADAVATLIDQLPDPETIKPENKTAVDAVLKQYEALTDEQKALLPAAEKEKIEALKAAFAGPSEEDQQIAEDFTEAVNALPTNKAGEVKAHLDNMTEMLSSMTEEQKALIPESTMAAYQEGIDAFKPGRKFCSGDGYYKVLSNGDVTYHHPADETISSAVVPNQVKKGKFLFKVIKISNYAFDGCENLEWIVIHKNIRVIGEDAFNGTTALSKINIKGSGIESGKVTDAFKGTGKNLTVKVPSKKLDEYRELFTGEGGLNGSVRAA